MMSSLLIGLSGLLALCQPAAADTLDRIAAVVNNEIITLSEVYSTGGEYITENVGKKDGSLRSAELEVLDTLILRSLVTQELRNLAMDVTEEELQNSLVDIAKSNGLTPDRLRTEVERSGLEWNAYLQEIKQSLRQMKFNQLILQPRIVVDDNALQEAYRQLAQNQPDMIDLYGIFVKGPSELRPASKVAEEQGVSLEEAQALVAKLQAQQEAEFQAKLTQIQSEYQSGTPFVELVKKYDGMGMGGKIGSFAQGQLRYDLGLVAFALKEGELSEPVPFNNGVYLLFVQDRYPQPPPEFEQVKGRLLDAYYAERFEQELEIWYSGAKSRAAVEIRLQEFASSAQSPM